MFKVKTNQGPALLNEIFRSQNYIGPTLRRSKDFLRPNVRNQKYEEKSLKRMGNVKWNLLPNEIKDVETLEEFKSKIRIWKPEKCPCYLCKDFLAGVGIIEICDCQNC